MEELKPCPFCGGEAVVCGYPSEQMVYVKCRECGACSFGCQANEEKAAAAWNTRAERTCQFFYDKKMAEYACSACGERVSGSNPADEYEVTPLAVLESFEVCPHCGAKVVE